MKEQLREMSAPALAHVGDAVFELMVRTYLCENGTWSVNKLHEKTVTFVSAKGQSEASALLMPLLTEDEKDVFMRGRNAHSGSVPKNSTGDEYHTATALEALFGYLYLAGEQKRLGELFLTVIQGER